VVNFDPDHEQNHHEQNHDYDHEQNHDNELDDSSDDEKELDLLAMECHPIKLAQLRTKANLMGPLYTGATKTLARVLQVLAETQGAYKLGFTGMAQVFRVVKWMLPQPNAMISMRQARYLVSQVMDRNEERIDACVRGCCLFRDSLLTEHLLADPPACQYEDSLRCPICAEARYEGESADTDFPVPKQIFLVIPLQDGLQNIMSKPKTARSMTPLTPFDLSIDPKTTTWNGLRDTTFWRERVATDKRVLQEPRTAVLIDCCDFFPGFDLTHPIGPILSMVVNPGEEVCTSTHYIIVRGYFCGPRKPKTIVAGYNRVMEDSINMYERGARMSDSSRPEEESFTQYALTVDSTGDWPGQADNHNAKINTCQKCNLRGVWSYPATRVVFSNGADDIDRKTHDGTLRRGIAAAKLILRGADPKDMSKRFHSYGPDPYALLSPVFSNSFDTVIQQSQDLMHSAAVLVKGHLMPMVDGERLTVVLTKPKLVVVAELTKAVQNDGRPKEVVMAERRAEAKTEFDEKMIVWQGREAERKDIDTNIRRFMGTKQTKAAADEAYASVQGPTGFAKGGQLPFASRYKFKSSHWQVAAESDLLDWVLAFAVPNVEAFKTLCKITKAIRLVSGRSSTPASRASIVEHVRRLAKEALQELPTTEHTAEIHMLVELAIEEVFKGCGRWRWMYPFER
jgi:hypothetical protein